MGCGGGKSAAVDTPTKEAAEHHEPEEEQVWATKTEAAKRPGQPQTSVQTLNSGKSPQASNKGNNAWSVEDADDEIEIVDEGNKQQPRDKGSNVVTKIGADHIEASNVANAQEAPQSEMLGMHEMDGGAGGGQKKPLPPQQAEEAAKLAEQRKRFDNQRYQNSLNQATSPAAVPRAANPAPANDVAAVPLSLNNTVSTPNKESKNLGAFLPGGVLDDLEDLNDLTGLEKEIRKPMEEDDLNDVGKNSNGGFDEADEALMKEILEDFDDV